MGMTVEDDALLTDMAYVLNGLRVWFRTIAEHHLDLGGCPEVIDRLLERYEQEVGHPPPPVRFRTR